MGPGSAQNPHVLRVRSGFCTLANPKLASTITPGGIGSYPEMMLCEEFISI
ncbi:DNA metabolism protein [Salmonella enterica subsp. enterica serovar Brancaster]|uniref:DNA metabolism protein n=4 Tax=Salmonella enterica TaxID=28901 RepID=A0A5U6GCT7_SALET|nr:DNA metabolism protein [Salmonella enterica subsp. enterica serovar Derby]AXD23877.1 DNA metabolism protein [Salmonella enterica]EAA1528399.1 DNA metabolism protein [Salmonella enterica subsp. enterica serovar Tennessee]EAA4031869.1 DNA metabolism protein [Salmonella enterica subsp. enterica serovar Rissen]EAA9371017.1 DNA metabolism protein [Salmonella enterica subsp. enterica]EBC9161928.1 DNA metabolism protein [Salmonella enterica subsp. enterica serovar Heidelberg]EBR8199541.1 DNA meta